MGIFLPLEEFPLPIPTSPTSTLSYSLLPKSLDRSVMPLNERRLPLSNAVSILKLFDFLFFRLDAN
jgi:hypothetical protein